MEASEIEVAGSYYLSSDSGDSSTQQADLHANKTASAGCEQSMVEYPVSNLCSCRLTVVARGSEVNAREDPCVLHFVQRLRKAREGAAHADHEIVVHGETALFAKKVSKYHCRRGADRRVARGVLRKVRRREEWYPQWIRTCGRVAVGVGERDRGTGRQKT
jgi:hypothetical protein